MIEFALFEGIWIGEGEMCLSLTEDPVPLRVRIEIVKSLSKVTATVTYHIENAPEPIINRYEYKEMIDRSFKVTLSNKLWGEAEGVGSLEKNFIGLEFPKTNAGFEGYEAYELEDNQSFHIRGAFITEEDIRSEIFAKVVKYSPVSGHKMEIL